MTPAVPVSIYVLDGHEPVPCNSFVTFNRFLSTANPLGVARDTVGNVRVCSVFVAICSETPARLFETTIFGGAHDRHCVRAETWDECLRNHAQALRMIGAGSP